MGRDTLGRKYKYYFSLVFLIIFSVVFGIPKTQAAGSLDAVRDLINSIDYGTGDVYHEIAFTLPPEAQQIRPSDWILILMPDFRNITLPTDIEGGFGTPDISLNGTTVRITNIALLPGTRIKIHNITADNPQIGQSFNITIRIVEGSADGLIRNQATTTAGPGDTFNTLVATVESPLCSINISGYTSPEAFVSLYEDDVVIGTTGGAGNGAFSFPVSGLNQGNHTFRISATDRGNRGTSQAVVQLYLIRGTLTTASGIILSPTIGLDRVELDPGDSITASGEAMPSSQINIFTESPLRSYTVNTDASGYWSFTLSGAETQAYGPGQYRIYTNVQDGIGNQSITSGTLNFTILSPDAGENPPPACDISRGDLNCDTRTNLTDFSILLFHWRTNHRRADINKDSAVNLVDFSIMMYYFRR